MGEEKRNPDINLDAKAEETFSAERVEDIWALIIAFIVFLVCMIMPEQVHEFFKHTLYW
ncbi:MAG: hypothetical protein H0Z39_02850 [Peptococcaceae bacterium]|nr:hypothetical protein [Peptococcaceae bacterium]